MTDLHRFQSFDGVSIGYRTLGDPAGWPILMLHGFLASAESNWFLPAARTPRPTPPPGRPTCWPATRRPWSPTCT